MVREVQMSWDSESPMPEELNHGSWDCDDPAIDQPEDEKGKRPNRASSPTENSKQENPDR